MKLFKTMIRQKKSMSALQHALDKAVTSWSCGKQWSTRSALIPKNISCTVDLDGHCLLYDENLTTLYQVYFTEWIPYFSVYDIFTIDGASSARISSVVFNVSNWKYRNSLNITLYVDSIVIIQLWRDQKKIFSVSGNCYGRKQKIRQETKQNKKKRKRQKKAPSAEIIHFYLALFKMFYTNVICKHKGNRRTQRKKNQFISIGWLPFRLVKNYHK